MEKTEDSSTLCSL
ncbi:rCG61342 [Rattus norvegicus]|uniref:RCG61342 n=1 Tax=Rattus norvegicus TaxID=10116 RepID=A6HC51_RAT|nr:rCG61342 [Rattus norvegicus]